MRTSVLVVEGDPDFSEVVVETFSSNEYSVRAVSTIEDAIAEIEKETPDVVLVSDALSNGSGEELCRKLNEKRGHAEVPALILLTDESDPRRVLVSDSCVDACLHRPVDPVVLESTVESIIQLRKRQAPTNPLTKLPGPTALSREMEKRAISRGDYSMLTFRFNPAETSAYKRKYGELKYLTMVRLAAHTVSNCALTHGGKEAFVAHRGTPEEPEFVALIDARKADEFERVSCEEFAANSEVLYDKKDRAEGYLVWIDESGGRTAVPFVSLLAETISKEKVGLPGK